MRISVFILSTVVSSLLVSCAQQEVAVCVDTHALHEGLRYADEVAAQSPFETVEISWSAAHSLMEDRNLAYRKARKSFLAAHAEEPLLTQLRSQLMDSVEVSLGDVLKPQAIVKSFQDPVVGLPKQLGSLSALKDISHEMEQDVWNNAGKVVEARAQMRTEQVKLYTLLSKGEVIARELERLDEEELSDGVDQEDSKWKAARQKWVVGVEKDRADWLREVRDFFNAEYHNVVFRKDASAKPDYSDVSAPDLGDWQRWCFLSRSQSLVKALQEEHKKSKPTVPGTRAMKGMVNEMLNKKEEYVVTLSTSKVRSEVRKLISNWREMKRTQSEIASLSQGEEVSSDSQKALARAQKVYKLRCQEIQHAGIVWMMDEHCWDQ